MTHSFDVLAQHERFKFIGNVRLSDPLSLSDLTPHYHGLVLCYGASKDRELGLLHEKDLPNFISARAFVNWYNGLPGYQAWNLPLQSPNVIVIGQGNVALDVARILLEDVSNLISTDIAQYALEALKKK